LVETRLAFVDRCLRKDELAGIRNYWNVQEVTTRGLVGVVVTAARLLLSASPAPAAAPTSASCAGQFFSSHAGLAAQHTAPANVGESVSATAQELGCEFGASISATRDLSREVCGL